MLVIGLSGRACAGKNLFAREFEKQGCLVVDVDLLGHEALAKNVPAIRQAFGDSVITEDTVNRKALGVLVFSDASLLKQLEAITHPTMVGLCQDRIAEAEKNGAKGIVLNAALLHRMGLDRLCDHIVFVKVPFLVRFFRSRKRDHLGFRRFLARERAQKDIVWNNFTQGVPVEKMRNGGPSVIIHRQVVQYCARIGIGVSGK
ncbi:dephospho-CoA kinase [Sphaerochaeta pleomorpha str. Grapes]|uniref:Dephospho-CoA kinase n=1 Tax=Sphaerochaeta pleomorpha (strain ATCC BAA-1885 / DSM 22778 / Grapes) TaxID=158190 RepID=G8QSP8_SPHPG|nr:dephospho-CoA kinase [Sphaerochaeta pleomorpha]AEV29009.1 dephospho-CoA kinase [Sphaerochaeta pleomorpha str. Grapes]